LDVTDSQLRTLLSGKKYRFYRQVGSKKPQQTIYSSYNFPDLEIWRTLAMGSLKTPLICAPLEEDPYDKNTWRTEEEYNDSKADFGND